MSFRPKLLPPPGQPAVHCAHVETEHSMSGQGRTFHVLARRGHAIHTRHYSGVCCSTQLFGQGHATNLDKFVLIMKKKNKQVLVDFNLDTPQQRI